MLPKCPEEVQRPMFAPQFQPGLCEPANRSGTRGVGYILEWATHNLGSTEDNAVDVVRSTLCNEGTPRGINNAFFNQNAGVVARSCVVMHGTGQSHALQGINDNPST